MHESAFGRVIGALVSPEKTFRSIAERPTWVVPLLLLVLVTGLVGYAAGERVDFEKQIRREMAERGGVSEDEVQQAVGFMEKFGRILFVLPAVFAPVVYLLIALIFLVALRLSGSEIGFGQSFSVMLHAMMPWVIHALLSLPLILRQETIDPQAMERGGLLMSNLAALAPEDSGKVLLSLLASLDLFTVWTLILLTIGYRVVARVSTATAATVAVTLWLLYLAGKLGLTAVFS
jgi:hypothetical protein